MSPITDIYVPRKRELEEFRRFCDDSQKQVLFIHGRGGIGKTLLIQAMLDVADELAGKGVMPAALVLKELIDLNSTRYRHIDGLQSRIADMVEAALGRNAFEKYRARPTSASFHDCLAAVCQEHPLFLALDTFERIQEDAAGHWVLRKDPEGFIVPGLHCIIGSRKEPKDEDKEKGLIQPMPLEGFTFDQAAELYRQQLGTDDIDVKWLEELCDKTKGHPLFLSIVFEWSVGGQWSKEVVDSVRKEGFEEELMGLMQEWGDRGVLSYRRRRLSVSEWQTIVLMSYLDRRFDLGLLSFLQRSGCLVGLGPQSLDDIGPRSLMDFEQMFFVKKVEPDGIRLHDEMASLIRTHIWPKLDPTKCDDLRAKVIEWYDELIQSIELNIQELSKQEQNASRAEQDALRAKQNALRAEQDVLRAEQLDYIFRLNKQQGKERLQEYANLRHNELDRLLPIEARQHVGAPAYSNEDRFDIHRCIAELETRNEHFEQAISHWKECLRLADKLSDTRRKVVALVGLHNATWSRAPAESLSEYLQPALEMCQGEAQDLRALVEYEIGFAHRQLQDIKKAIEWYLKGLQSARKIDDNVLLGTLLNDLGYAYTFVGKYQEATAYVQMAETVRAKCVEAIEAKIASAREHGLVQRSVLAQWESELAEARLKYGMTLNTLGEILRYRNRLPQAENYYTRALEVFKELSSEEWLIRAYHGRGEARRRQAADRLFATSVINLDSLRQAAKSDFEEALYLCEKHHVDKLRDTVHRRMGRFLHDEALRERERNPQKARECLDLALHHFRQGLRFARQFDHVLEEFENAVEIAFLADDWARLTGGDEKERETQEGYIQQLADTLEAHAHDNPRIYQYPVFEKLLLLERGAFSHALGQFDDAKESYVKAFTGLASEAGYGLARYYMHVNHVMEAIEQLPTAKLRRRWCQAFVDAWEHTGLQGDQDEKTLQGDQDKKTLQKDQDKKTLREVIPYFYTWCNLYLMTLEDD